MNDNAKASIPKFSQEILSKCNSVLCYNANPEEKAYLVKILRGSMKKVVLAIGKRNIFNLEGDGSNDVSMLREANIGIAVYNSESARVFQTADFIIPHFSSLWKLLFVHGRWNYMRTASFIMYFFYKNMIFTIPQIIFCFYNAYSGQSIFEDWFIAFYNILFTSVPIVIRSIFDKDVYYLKWGQHANKQLYLRDMPNLRDSFSYLYHGDGGKRYFNLSTLMMNIVSGVIFGILISLVTLK